MSPKEKKEKLSMKVHLAQTSPDSTYDLSDCGAALIPDDTYTYCKLLMKSKLILRNNCLSSLDCGGSIQDLINLQIIDVSNNRIDGFNKQFLTYFYKM